MSHDILEHTGTHWYTLVHTATHCNTLQHTATHCNTLLHTATHCYTLHHTATHCNTLQRTATHCNTLQHTATPTRCKRVWVCLPYCSRRRSDLTYLDFQIGRFSRQLCWVTGTSIYSHENLFEIVGTPVKTCLKVKGIPWQLVWILAVVNMLSPISSIRGHVIDSIKEACVMQKRPIWCKGDLCNAKEAKEYVFHVTWHVSRMESDVQKVIYGRNVKVTYDRQKEKYEMQKMRKSVFSMSHDTCHVRRMMFKK